MEYILYIDEAGCPGELPSPTSNIQPIFCLVGLIIPQIHLNAITHEILALKRQFNPKYADTLQHDLEIVSYEIKGSDIRADARHKSRNKRRRAYGLLDKILAILNKYDCHLLARGYVKEPAGKFDGNAVYTASMQALCSGFEHFLNEHNAHGIIVADSRKKQQNHRVSYSIFTKKFKLSGDDFPNISELPVFGHSENHVGLQVADWLASALLFPIIAHVYCTGHIQSVHVRPNYKYDQLQSRYAPILKAMQYRYAVNGNYKGGITVIDGILKSRSAALMFQVE